MFDMKLYEKLLSEAKIGDALLCQNLGNKPYIIINNNSNYNNDENYEIIKTQHCGGVGVIFPLDLGFTWINNRSILGDIVNDVCFYLIEKNVPVYGEGNDIMINDKKLFGTMSVFNNDKYYEGIFLSFNTDTEVIKKICKKEMVKVPVGLAEYKITPEEMITLCQNLIKKYGLREVE